MVSSNCSSRLRNILKSKFNLLETEKLAFFLIKSIKIGSIRSHSFSAVAPNHGSLRPNYPAAPAAARRLAMCLFISFPGIAPLAAWSPVTSHNKPPGGSAPCWREAEMHLGEVGREIYLSRTHTHTHRTWLSRKPLPARPQTVCKA